MNLTDWKDADLAYELSRQEWQGISTWGAGICGHAARGCGVCADCLRSEIQRRAALTQDNDK